MLDRLGLKLVTVWVFLTLALLTTWVNYYLGDIELLFVLIIAVLWVLVSIVLAVITFR